MEKTILIIAAMEEELNYLKAKLNNEKEMEYKGTKFFEGKLFNKKVILCEASIGLINAAFSTTIAIEKYNPNIIINIGLARRLYKRCTKRRHSYRNRYNKYNIGGMHRRWKYFRRL